MASALLPGNAVAQCTLWLPGEAYPGINGWGSATLVLPNGDVVVGGTFAGAAHATRDIARWDGTAWHGLGTGFDGYGCYALALAPNGDLIAGGNFLNAGNAVCNKLARWNGFWWASVGGGVDPNGHVNTVLSLPNGDLMVGGYLTMAGTLPVSNLALWNGTSWSSMGLGADDWVYKLALMPNGDVIAAGRFTSMNGQLANRVARWNGSSWAPLGTGLDNDVVDAIVLPNGDLVVCGAFTTAGGQPAPGLARWDGVNWSAFGGAANGYISCLGLHQGQLVVGGQFPSIGGVPAVNIARWTGTTWTPFGSGIGAGGFGDGVLEIASLPSGSLMAVGNFGSAGGSPARSVALWNGTSWQPTGTGCDGEIKKLVRTNTGYVAIGDFQSIGGIAAPGGARHDGSGWTSFPAQGFNDLGVLPNGDLVATGFSSFYRYSWSGSWVQIPTTLTVSPWFGATISKLVVMPNGDVVVGGSFTSVNGVACNHVARWNGSAWAPLGSGLNYVPMGSPFTPPRVDAMAVMSNGDLIVAGRFNQAGGNPANGIARWNGTTWAPLGPGITDVMCMTGLANGDLVVGGWFTSPGSLIARWNGTAWSPLGSGIQADPGSHVKAVVELGNGHLIVGGEFSAAGGLPANKTARWDGSSWHPMGNGVQGVGYPGVVNTLLALQPDRVVVGGLFVTADQQPSSNLAQWGCPATGGGTLALATSFGSGCGQVTEIAYEHFPNQALWDLDQSTLHFDFSGATYAVSHQPGAPAFHTPTSAPLALTDDQVSGAIVLPFAVPAPFGSFQQIYVSSNGRVFSAAPPPNGYVAYYGAVSHLLYDAQFCPLFGDWDPSTGSGSGSIHCDIDASAQVVYVTWQSIQAYGQPSQTATFQLAIAATGDIEYRYVSCPSLWYEHLVGTNLGVIAPDPGSSDLSAQSLVLGAARPPLQHQALSRPIAGTSVVLQTGITPPACSLGATVLAFTGPPGGLPLDFLGMPNCRQYVDMVAVLYWVPSANTGQITLPIPPGPTFLGVQVLSQSLALDPGYNALGVIVSNGLDLRIGNT